MNTATYATLVETERILEDPWWYITRNWRSVEPGDELFIIIGFATIEELKKWPDGWRIRLNFDLAKCRALLVNPIPAPIVRGWIRFPRGNVLNLAPFAIELCSLLPWRLSPQAVGSEAAL